MFAGTRPAAVVRGRRSAARVRFTPVLL